MDESIFEEMGELLYGDRQTEIERAYAEAYAQDLPILEDLDDSGHEKSPGRLDFSR